MYRIDVTMSFSVTEGLDPIVCMRDEAVHPYNVSPSTDDWGTTMLAS